MMNFDQFVEMFNPIRNTFELNAPLENMMYEAGDEDQMEKVESKDPTLVWSYDPRKGLVNGIHYQQDYIGYIICKNPCMYKPNEIHVKI